jgi:PAS domain-containing protein
MLAPVLGAVLLTLLLAALVTSWRRSRALVRATDALRESHARRLLQERLAQERARVEHERAAFLADVSTVVADSLDVPVAVATVARLAVPFLADVCVVDLLDSEGRLARAAAVHADPGAGTALARHYRAAPPMHPLLAAVLRDGKPQDARYAPGMDLAPADPDGRGAAVGVLLPLTARGRTLGVVSLFRCESGRRFTEDDRGLAGDLTHRIALAVDNARLYHAADDAHRRFQDLVEGLGAVVWESDAVRRHYTFVSGRAISFLGHPLGRWYDEPDFWLAVQHPDDRERSAAASRGARAEGSDHDLEYRVLRADGGVVWVLDLVRVVRHPDGRVRHLRGVMVDITERKDGEVARRQAEALASVAALAAAAAHEINNPLAVLQASVEILARRGDVPPPVSRRIDPMLDAVRRIAAIVASMRQITRLENIPTTADLPAMLDLKRCGGGVEEA